MKSTNFKRDGYKMIISLLGSYIFILVANLILGSSKIIDAHNNQFRGGYCGVCQSCERPICQEKIGFELYSLYLSLILFSFIAGIISSISTKKSLYNYLVVFSSTISFIILTELIIKIFSIPVLYTHFLEGRQWLDYSAFSYFGHLGLYNLLLVLPLVILSKVSGNILILGVEYINKKFLKKK